MGFTIVTSPIWTALSDWELNAEFDSTSTDDIQAAFEALDTHKLIYQGAQGRRNLNHYIRLVAGRPRILRNHVKRIYLATALNDRAELAAAMVDFFWVVKSKAPVLRKRLLEQLSPILPEDVKSLLLDALQTGEVKGLQNYRSDKTVIVNGRFSLVV